MKKSAWKLIFVVFSLLMVLSMTIFSSSALSMSDLYPLDEESPLRDLSIGFYGDSICEGNVEKDTDHASVRAWAGRIASVNGCEFYNYGRSGASISNCRGGNTVINQLKTTKSEGRQYDIIVLHGGVNDAWDAVEVGEMEDAFPPTDKYDASHFAGGLEQTLSYVEENFPDAMVCYIINFKFLNASMGIKLMDMDEYVDMTIDILEKWGIPYLDLYHNEEVVNTLHPYTTGPSGVKYYQKTYLYDFVHPSTEGFDVLYPYINDFLIELVDPYYNDPAPDPEPEPKPEPEPTPEEPTPDPEPKPDPKPQSGCGAVMGATAMSLVALILPTTVGLTRKRKED